MDAVTFASILLKTLFAWPVILLVIALIFKREFVKLIGRVSEINFGNGGAKFRELLSDSSGTLLNATMSGDLSIEVPSSGKTINKVMGAEVVLPDEDEFSFTDGALAPRAQIMMTWLTLEKEIIKFATLNGVAFESKRTPITKLLRILHDKGYINKPLFDVTMQLSSARNEAVHLSEKELTVSDYVAFAATTKGAYRGFRNQGRLGLSD